MSFHPLAIYQNFDLLVIFGFVLAVVAIANIAKWQRDRLWHDTARMALEKGQPIPTLDHHPRAWRKYRRGYRGGRCFPRGLVTIAVGVALYFIAPEGLGRWWILPVLVGSAQFVIGLISLLSPDRDEGPDDLPPATK
jgi:hypothetical protein